MVDQIIFELNVQLLSWYGNAPFGGRLHAAWLFFWRACLIMNLTGEGEVRLWPSARRIFGRIGLLETPVVFPRVVAALSINVEWGHKVTRS